MKVLFVHDHRFANFDNKYYSPGGLPKSVWKRYLNYFTELVVLGRVLHQASKEDLTISSCTNVSFELLDYLRSPIDEYRYRTQILYDTKEIINKYQVEAAIVRLPSGLGYKAIEICKELNIPYSVEVVGCTYDAIYNYKFTPWYNYKNLLVKLYAPLAYMKMRFFVRQAKFVIYVTEHFLQDRYPAHLDAITSYASNVELPEFGIEIIENHIKLLQRDTDEIRFGMIGNADVLYKGYDVALKALFLIKNKIPDFKLYLIGGGRGFEVKRMAKELGIIENLVFVGKLQSGSEVFSFLDQLDVYLHPSRQEGLPRSLIEAMGRGCPCLGSTTAGIPELLPEAFLHKTGDYRTLSKQIIELIGSKEKLLIAAETNFKKSKNYTIEVLTRRRNKFWGSFYRVIERQKNNSK